VVACRVLEHLRGPRGRPRWRVLRPGGRFLFITPNKFNYVVGLRRLVPAVMSERVVRAVYRRDEDFVNPTFYRANSYREIERLMKGAGMRCLRFEHVGDPTYLALNELLFRAAVLVERLIDRAWPQSRVHLVGVYEKTDRDR
jgi:SAM-dependent methyltransferase